MSIDAPVRLIIKYWSSLMAIASAGFLTGSWAQGRAIATVQAVQAQEISDVRDALKSIVAIEAGHTEDMARVSQELADVQARLDRSHLTERK